MTRKPRDPKQGFSPKDEVAYLLSRCHHRSNISGAYLIGYADGGSPWETMAFAVLVLSAATRAQPALNKRSSFRTSLMANKSLVGAICLFAIALRCAIDPGDGRVRDRAMDGMHWGYVALYRSFP